MSLAHVLLRRSVLYEKTDRSLKAICILDGTPNGSPSPLTMALAIKRGKDGERLIHTSEVRDLEGLAEALGKSVASVRDYIRREDFPTHVLMLGRSKGWLLPEVLKWWDDRVSGGGENAEE